MVPSVLYIFIPEDGAKRFSRNFRKYLSVEAAGYFRINGATAAQLQEQQDCQTCVLVFVRLSVCLFVCVSARK
jgi:hypothetical protein